MQHELHSKQHAQVQLEQLLHSPEGEHLVRYLWQSQLSPFVAAGMHVAAFEVVFSQNNNKLKPHYKRYLIRNKLGCQHQDLREDEPWFNRVSSSKQPLPDIFTLASEASRFPQMCCTHGYLWAP